MDVVLMTKCICLLAGQRPLYDVGRRQAAELERLRLEHVAFRPVPQFEGVLV